MTNIRKGKVKQNSSHPEVIHSQYKILGAGRGGGSKIRGKVRIYDYNFLLIESG